MTPCIWFWIAAIVIFIIAEAVTVALVSVWFIGGAVCALLAAIFGAPGLAQAAVFVIVSALLLILVCPLVKKKLKAQARTPERRPAGRSDGHRHRTHRQHSSPPAPSRSAAYSGRQNARPARASRPAAHVKILRVEGAKLLVEPVEVPVNIR